MWPREISRQALNPYYQRAEEALRVQRPTWNQVAKSAKWCHTGCIFGAKNSVMTNYLPAAEALGVEVRPNSQAELVRQSVARPYRYVVTASEMDNEGADATRQPSGTTFDVECKVLILAAGAMGNSPLLMRSRPFLPSLSLRVGKHLGINGDHIAAVEYDERKVRDVLGLPGYGQIYKGNHITTMSYDWWAGRAGHPNDGKRFTLQEIYLSQLAHTLYDDARAPSGAPSWWGLQKKAALSTFNNHVEILAMVEDTHDGEFLAPPPTGSHIRPNAGPVGIGPFNYTLSEQSQQVREAANAAIRSVVERNGLGRLMEPTYRNVSAAHPLGGCRMADSKDFGVVDHRCEVFGYPGLFCTDSSSIPTSLGVNPSLTISAVAERACEQLIARAADYGLPMRPSGFRPGVPAVSIGPHVTPRRRSSDAEVDAKVRSYG
jgi:hypothetical protein